MTYYSERLRGPKPRTEEGISEKLWKGIAVVLDRFIEENYLSKAFPNKCSDNGRAFGTDGGQLRNAIEAEIPGFTWANSMPTDTPEAFLPLDIIEFTWNYAAFPTTADYHEYFGHYHLNFDVDKGRVVFREAINEVFARYGSVYELEQNGHVIRLAAAIIGETLKQTVFNTGDPELDKMLETARGKFFNVSLDVRKEALETLWDAFERIKTLEPGKDKKAQVSKLIDKSSKEPNFKKLVDDEGNTLTAIGNNFMIRHKETNKTAINENEHVDYLFHRMFAWIRLVLRQSGRGG